MIITYSRHQHSLIQKIFIKHSLSVGTEHIVENKAEKRNSFKCYIKTIICIEMHHPWWPAFLARKSTLCIWHFETPRTVAHQASFHGILQARILERTVISFSMVSSQCRDQTQSPASQADSLPSEAPRKPIYFWFTVVSPQAQLESFSINYPWFM